GFATILAYGAGSIPYPDMHLFWNLPIILSAVFLFLFKSSALNLKTHTPKLYKTFFILTALHVITMSYTMATGAGRMSLIFTPFIITVAIACAFVRTKQGYKPAVFFVYGWSIFFLGFIIGALQLVFPIHNSFHFAGFIGFAIEIILFSFGLALRLITLPAFIRKQVPRNMIFTAKPSSSRRVMKACEKSYSIRSAPAS
ncbi:MAG: 7TM-DISM domain-containing protein, partial [Pseudobdellovibrionaceae bacterium]|nr:7TM-DISM domain-containing protein [Pseudobdellovibrionaceae bacterium]